MQVRLKYWQITLFILPFLLGNLFLELPHHDLSTYQERFRIAEFLNALSIFLFVFYQAYVVWGFVKTSNIKSKLFSINALIPVVFFSIYCISLIYFTFIRTIPPSNYVPGPVTKDNFTTMGIIILLFILHAAITFLFINGLFVSNQIKKIQDPETQQSLRTSFLGPMKTVLKTALYSFGAALLIIIIVDMVKIT